MPRSKISVNTSPVADQYSERDEKIIEFSSPNGGGLVSFSMMEDGTLTVDIYRTDPTVIVRTGDDVRTRLPRKVADVLARVIGAQADGGFTADGTARRHLVKALSDLAAAVRAADADSS
jgi:hypothetical protein